MPEYNTFVFDEMPQWDVVPKASVSSFHWETDPPYRPRTYARLCGVRGKGIYYMAESEEAPLRCKSTRRDDPVYEDSCLELFLNPLPACSDCYINVETNPCGVFLSQFGSSRESRVWMREVTVLVPEVSAYQKDGIWGVQVFLSDALIAQLYQTQYRTEAQKMRGNFYKCGDQTVHPHFGAFSPVDTAALGFHNPQRFADIILK